MEKISFTGTHGTGKTTSVLTEAKVSKLAYPTKKIQVLFDVAARSPYKRNKEASILNQHWVFSNQMSEELRMSTFNADLLFTDRTIMDCVAYSYCAGLHDLAEKQFQYALTYIETYNKIIFKTIDNNDYLMEDGIRDNIDLEYRSNVEKEMMKYYEKAISLGCKFIFEVV